MRSNRLSMASEQLWYLKSWHSTGMCQTMSDRCVWRIALQPWSNKAFTSKNAHMHICRLSYPDWRTALCLRVCVCAFVCTIKVRRHARKMLRFGTNTAHIHIRPYFLTQSLPDSGLSIFDHSAFARLRCTVTLLAAPHTHTHPQITSSVSMVQNATRISEFSGYLQCPFVWQTNTVVGRSHSL